MTLTFTVLGIAAPQGSMRAIPSRDGRRAFLKHDNARTMPWRHEVTAIADRARQDSADPWPTSGPVEMRVVFYLPRPGGHFGKKGLRKSAPLYPATKPDLSKLVRAVEDALIGIVFNDDARVVRHHVEKLYADYGAAPRAVFEIETLVETVAERDGALAARSVA
jgi:Holliday junction resolvase RusA-like endonuclease